MIIWFWKTSCCRKQDIETASDPMSSLKNASHTTLHRGNAWQQASMQPFQCNYTEQKGLWIYDALRWLIAFKFVLFIGNVFSYFILIFITVCLVILRWSNMSFSLEKKTDRLLYSKQEANTKAMGLKVGNLLKWKIQLIHHSQLKFQLIISDGLKVNLGRDQKWSLLNRTVIFLSFSLKLDYQLNQVTDSKIGIL